MIHIRCKKRDKKLKIKTQILENFSDTEQVTVFCLDKGLAKQSLEFVKSLVAEETTTKSLIVKIVESKESVPIYFDEKNIYYHSNFDELEIRLSFDDVFIFFENFEDFKLSKNYGKFYFLFTSQDFFNVDEVDDYFKSSLFIFDKKRIKKEQIIHIKEMKDNQKLENISIIVMRK